MNNRFARVNSMKPLVRVFEDQLATIRVISERNLDSRGQLQSSIGRKTGDYAVTVLVEYGLSVRGYERIRVTLMGSLAEQAIKDGLKEGDQIRFDGKEAAKHYCAATWYEKVEVGNSQVTKASVGL